MKFEKESGMKRLAIFFFYDKEGIVDDYIPYMLKDLNQNIDELLVVCNGKLTPEGREKFYQFTSNVLVRENKGFDVWAYKEGMMLYGWEKLNQFDEIILMNFTIMGPLYPFSEMFHEMDKRDLDFWGITAYHGAPYDPFNKIKYKYLPKHIQSHFIAVRKSMFDTPEFRKYWEAMPDITCYEEAVCWHEAIFTKDFADKGFKWAVYVDTTDLEKHSYCPIIMSPLELVKNRRCPIIKRRSFFHNYEDLLSFTNGEPSVELLEYIENNLDYDVNLIWDNILRVENQSDIKQCLHLNYVLPTKHKTDEPIMTGDTKIALIMHIHFPDLIQYCFEYASSMPEHADVYITTNSKEKKEKIEEVFSKLKCNKLEVILIENRGRDVSALLVTCKDFIMDYDLVCFAHDKKVGQLDMAIKGESFSYKCFENILKNKTYVENVIQTFSKNKRLGLLTPPPPNFGEYYPTIGYNDWGANYYNTVNLVKKLDLKVKIDPGKAPVAPFGTMFWFRPKALKTLFDADWKYEDFPKEPNDVDGTLLHAIERVYPLVVQHEGYYPAWVMADTYARIEITGLHYMIRALNQALFAVYGPNTHHMLVSNIKQQLSFKFLVKLYIKGKAQKVLPMKVYNALIKIKKKIFK